MLILLALLISLVAAIGAYWFMVLQRTEWYLLKKLPGPSMCPLLGNLHQAGVTAEEHFTELSRWFKFYNHDMFRIYAGPQPYVIISDPKNMEFVMSSTTLTYKYDAYNFFYPWLGQGLLTANGKYWMQHRKMITPSFHFQILQDFLHIINETTDRFSVLLDEYAQKQCIFDFQDIVTRSTIDVICESAMGTPVNAIQGPISPMVPAIIELCDVMQRRIFSAFKRSDLIFALTSDYRRQQNALKTLRKELSEIIEKRRLILKELEQNPSTNEFQRPKRAFLDNLLTAEIDGKPLTFQEIFEEVSTFVFEGHDTTASAIGFAIFCLSRHAEVQAKAFAEQQAMFGNDLERNASYQNLQDMKYLELVIKETLRLFPSVPFIARTLQEKTTIGDYVIPAGTSITLNIIGIASDPRNFKDPYKFQPERFELDERAKAHAYDYVPFSAGSRNCIGQKFAMMELKVTISKILRHFEILPAVEGLSSGIHDPCEPVDKLKHPYEPRLGMFLTLKSVNGLQIRLKRRVY